MKFAECEYGHVIKHSGRKRKGVGKHAVEVPKVCVRCNSQIISVYEV